MFAIKRLILISALILIFWGMVLAEEKAKPQALDSSVKRHGVQPVGNGYTPKEGIDLDVQYENGKLLVFARGKTVKEVFAEIAKVAKIEIIVDEETGKEKTSLMFKDKSLKEGIESILNLIGLRNLAISYKEVTNEDKKTQDTAAYEIAKVEIRKRTREEMKKVEAEEEKTRQEEYQKKEKWYKNLFKDMGKKGKLEGMLKDYAEGKEVDGINTYLRQATIKPEEKPLLKKALWEPKYEELRGAIAMGLIHAIGDNPEESDKEFLLELLNKRKIDFLMYSMKFIWDDRFIPGLTDIVRDTTRAEITRSTAAEILGVRKVKEAVPALEEALAQMWGGENITYVHHALTEITGMTYDVINGKAIAHPYEPPKVDPDAGNYLSGK